jgi:hypothetical protein
MASQAKARDGKAKKIGKELAGKLGRYYFGIFKVYP